MLAESLCRSRLFVAATTFVAAEGTVSVAGRRQRKMTPSRNSAANPATKIYCRLLLKRGGSVVVAAASPFASAREFTEGSCELSAGAGAEAVPETEIVSGALAATESRV